MRKRIMAGLFAGVLALGGAFALPTAVQAAEQSIDPAIARALDSAEVVFTRHNREHRMWEIQRNMERQQRAGRRGYGPRPGYGPGPGYGRGYGPRPGYGYRGGQYGTPGWAGRPRY